MMTSTRFKFCGLTEPKDVDAAVAAGAAYVGFVFFLKSPRNLDPEAARDLALLVPPGTAKVGLVVDADDADVLEREVDQRAVHHPLSGQRNRPKNMVRARRRVQGELRQGKQRRAFR